MSNMVDVQTISIVVAAAGVFIAAINSIYSSRRAEEQRQLTLETQQHALETRQAQLFMQVYGQWTTPDFAKAYGSTRYKTPPEEFEKLVSDFRAHSPDLDLELYAHWQTLQTYFEGLGLLVKKGLLDITFVEDLFSNRILWWWEQHHSMRARVAS